MNKFSDDKTMLIPPPNTQRLISNHTLYYYTKRN